MNTKLEIKAIYKNELTVPQQDRCRAMFLKLFEVKRDNFYKSMESKNLKSDRLKFFADFFNSTIKDFKCTMDDLYSGQKPLVETGKSNGKSHMKLKNIGLVKA